MLSVVVDSLDPKPEKPSIRVPEKKHSEILITFQSTPI